ncbi:MAG: hypothetical protein KAS92_03670 [Candidatus Omnitrophica bacterium]|nr:hypothetical protein [Candidatus Omnitrophota bacterium]
MEESTNINKLKSVRKCVRLTKDMDKLFSMIADEHNTTVGKYLRDAGIILAEMSIDEREILELIKDKDKLKVQKKFQHLIEESKHSVLNSIVRVHEDMSNRFDKLEILLRAFLYVYLFHTPEVKIHLKESAKKSAQVREQKILSYVKNKLDSVKKSKDSD